MWITLLNKIVPQTNKRLSESSVGRDIHFLQKFMHFCRTPDWHSLLGLHSETEFHNGIAQFCLFMAQTQMQKSRYWSLPFCADLLNMKSIIGFLNNSNLHPISFISFTKSASNRRSLLSEYGPCKLKQESYPPVIVFTFTVAHNEITETVLVFFHLVKIRKIFFIVDVTVISYFL